MRHRATSQHYERVVYERQKSRAERDPDALRFGYF
jgi:hypothetical protein